MLESKNRTGYFRALEDFRHARAKARLKHFWAIVTGESLDLLRFNEITEQLRTYGHSSKGLQEIPIRSIIGSVNRYKDFDRNFLPLQDHDETRWANVKALMTMPGSPGLPPILVYKIGDVYFVLDGNHRVSIAKQMGIERIEAYVTEIQTKVPLSPDDSFEEVIIKAEYSSFLENTGIDRILPGVEFKLTTPGQYPLLEEHIHVHRYYMGIEQQREIPWDEGVRHWYNHVYLPVIEIITEENILFEFPGRTETDLYIWILGHQTEMGNQLGWAIKPDKAATDLLSTRSKRFTRVIKRLTKSLLEELLPEALQDFTKPGEWHQQKRSEQDNLFTDILVPVDGSAAGWIALDQAIIIAQLEKSEIRGLVIKKPYEWGLKENYDEDLARTFSERIHSTNIQGNLVFSQGRIAETITDRAKYNDLVILKLNFPPSTNFFNRLKSGTRAIVRTSTRPLLFVRDQPSTMDNLLLAYDGSPKGKEALYIAAYLAGRYQKKLTVLVIDDDEQRGNKRLNEAKDYLESQSTTFIFQKGTKRLSSIILDVADEINADMILMGGYGLSPIFEIFFGSTVDGVLRGTKIPVIVSK